MDDFTPSTRIGPTLASLLLAAAFLAVNVTTAARSPAIWTDEVMFTDPAVNLATGYGFTTTAWFQPARTFFAGNAPLYPLMLAPWIATFGVNPVAARSLNYVLVLVASFVLASAVGRAGWLRSPWSRLGLVGVLLCADGVAFSYRSGRYDALAMLVASAFAWMLTVHSTRPRALGLAILGALVPWTGLQLIPYLGLLGLAYLAVRRRAAIGDLAAAAAGGLIGAALLAGLFMGNGVWPEFVKSVANLGGAGQSLSERVRGVLVAPLTDLTGLCLLVSLALLVATDRAWRRCPALAGLLVGLAVPAALAFTGKYVKYYTWMAVAPMAVAWWTQWETNRPGRLARAGALLLVMLGCLAGLPARLGITALEWQARDVSPIDRLVEAEVRPSDRAYCVYEAYYPTKRRATALYLPPYIGDWADHRGAKVAYPMTPAERDAVDVLILKPDVEAATLRFFGGSWSPVGHYAAAPAARFGPLARLGVGSKLYDLTVFRRGTSAGR
jgi:hypothetical protein